MAKGKYQEWITPEGLLKIEGWARDGLTDDQISENMGIGYSTLQTWKGKYQDIQDTLKKGKEVIDRQVENALLKRALGYEYTEVTKERISDTGQKKRHEGAQELTEKQWDLAKAYFSHKCCYCNDSVDLTKDHLKPLNDGGKLSHDNVVPCCKSCNSSKKDHEWRSWFQRQVFYDKYRAQKICDYVDFVLGLDTGTTNDKGEMVITKVVTKEVVPDTTAQIFWLKNRKPSQWRDKQDVEHSGGIDVKSKYEAMSEEELWELAHRYEKINKV